MVKKAIPLSELIAREQKRAVREHLEKTLEQQLKAVSLFDGCKVEYQFHETRKWRFDFAWPDIEKKLAVEVEGGTKYGRSRHSKGTGFEKDAEKYNTASAMGWTLFRFTADAVKNGTAVLFIRDYLEGRR